MSQRPKFKDAIAEISNFVMPVAQAAASKQLFSRIWQLDKGWQVASEFSFKDYQSSDSPSSSLTSEATKQPKSDWEL